MIIFQSLTLIFCFITCVFLIFLILIQSSKGGSLGMFGGGSANTAFGVSTMDVVTKLTWWLVLVFFVLAILAAISFSEGGVPNTKTELSNPISSEKNLPNTTQNKSNTLENTNSK